MRAWRHMERARTHGEALAFFDTVGNSMMPLALSIASFEKVP